MVANSDLVLIRILWEIVGKFKEKYKREKDRQT
jgi:hypothetical protein